MNVCVCASFVRLADRGLPIAAHLLKPSLDYLRVIVVIVVSGVALIEVLSWRCVCLDRNLPVPRHVFQANSNPLEGGGLVARGERPPIPQRCKGAVGAS